MSTPPTTAAQPRAKTTYHVLRQDSRGNIDSNTATSGADGFPKFSLVSQNVVANNPDHAVRIYTEKAAAMLKKGDTFVAVLARSWRLVPILEIEQKTTVTLGAAKAGDA